jgi:ABC-type transporter Mla MlaB component
MLSGPATLYESAEIREQLLAALSEGKDLRIDLETSGPWDLAGLQLLISAVASGRKSGQLVRLSHVPRGFVEIASRAGLSGWLSSVTDSFI